MVKNTAAHLKQMLKEIYNCKKPFELLVIDKKPKTRMGVYIVEKQRIRVYARWGNVCPLEEIAIHEYAHHIHETEKRKNENRRKERVHGPEFWRIYSALMSVAQKKGLFTDSYIADIIDYPHLS
ncbi:MAG: hypothetical protein K2K45_07115 [Muribaculaceae bacterium]|nr:hypothetical protein [Paramuribaculum sp.]MDE6649682.1 hypothetical protein [Muribaculaceae bacterium]